MAHKPIHDYLITTTLMLFIILFSSITCVVEPNKIFKTKASSSAIRCHEAERDALIEFRHGLIDRSNRLSSWIGDECCEWMGIGCDNQTGHVVKLNLGNNHVTGYSCDDIYCRTYKGGRLRGKISNSLLELKYLNYFDLSGNKFSGISIPEFLGDFKNLNYLNLSCAKFGGMIPPHLGNLTNLRYLDLNKNSIWVSDLHWLSHLYSLKYLNLGSVDLSSANNHLLQSLQMLPFLSELHMPYCSLNSSLSQRWWFNSTASITVIDLSGNNITGDLDGFLEQIRSHNNLKVLYLCCNSIPGSIPALIGDFSNLEFLELYGNSITGSIPASIGDLSNLENLDLSDNSITGSIPTSIGNLSNLEHLYLLDNYITGSIPASIGNLSNLEDLDLSYNSITGSIPASIGNFSNLKHLYLSNNSITGSILASIGDLSNLERLYLQSNKLNGTIPESIGRLAKLEELDLSDNSWVGSLSRTHFRGLKKLDSFHISTSSKNFSMNIPPNWRPPFSLTDLQIDNCDIGPKFPSWLRSQKQLRIIILSNVGMKDLIPGWFGEFSTNIGILDFFNNQLWGRLPTSFNIQSPAIIDLSFNNLDGPIPLWHGVSSLSLANNLFSGSIPSQISREMPFLTSLDLSSNHLYGGIPSSLGQITQLHFLNLSMNKLSGKIHDNWTHWHALEFMDLSMNGLSGRVPSSLMLLPNLWGLKLNGNHFSGLGNIQSTNLEFIDLGDNNLSGFLPNWIGKNTRSLSMLRLRNNMLNGKIPKRLCRLSKLHILDLGNNKLVGAIPSCLGNISSLQNNDQIELPNSLSMVLVIKGRENSFEKILGLVKTIDLSNNNLHGDVPKELTNLSELGTLNLSHNQLTGTIPEMIGQLKQLETLDLSSNRLSGSIPPSMPSLTSLSHLNLSHNNLSGEIPTANQFLTLNDDPSIYEGNPRLCGGPLPTKCDTPGTKVVAEDEDQSNEEDDDKNEPLWLYVFMGAGYLSGFCAVVGALVINESWRHTYFHYLNRIKDWLIVVVSTKLARLHRKMEV